MFRTRGQFSSFILRLTINCNSKTADERPYDHDVIVYTCKLIGLSKRLFQFGLF